MIAIPLNEYILVIEEKAADVSQAGVGSAYDQGDRTASVAPKGKVVALGDPNVREIEITTIDDKHIQKVAVGDMVLVAKWEAHKTTINTKEHLLVKKEHILAVLKDEKER